MLKVAGVRQTLAELKSAKLKIEVAAAQRYRNLVEVMFIDIVSHTPQYTGNLAANWVIAVGVGNTSGAGASFQQVFDPVDRQSASEAGDDEAIEVALSRSTEALARIRYNSDVAIINTASYAEEVDAGISPAGTRIRKVNKYYGSYVPPHGVAMAAYVEMKYENLRYKRLAYEGRYFDNIHKQK